jgi:hypothetical protein
VDPCLGKGRDVIIPSRLSRVSSVYAREHDHWWSACAYGLAYLGECLVVSDSESEFRHHVRGGRHDGITIDDWMRTVLVRQSRSIAHRQPSYGLDPIQFIQSSKPGGGSGCRRHRDRPSVLQ